MSRIVLQRRKIQGDELRLEFGTLAQGRVAGVPLETRFGRLYFYLSQQLEAVLESDGWYRLSTRKYWYRIQPVSSPNEQAHFRWEYESPGKHDGHPRHHIQLRSDVQLDGHVLDLNKLHVPTGWVTIEEIIRFLIVDLGVKPAGDDWPERLRKSERSFYEDFTVKRYKPPV